MIPIYSTAMLYDMQIWFNLWIIIVPVSDVIIGNTILRTYMVALYIGPAYWRYYNEVV